MAEPSQHINYSFEDIQRYLQGKMPAAEMHELEKAALADPFLSDAIEGFNKVDFTVAKQHLNEINASLFAEKKESKIVTFNKRTQWLNIAAIIIVLAGIGLVASYFISTSSSTQKNAIAKLKQEEIRNETPKDSASALADMNASNKNADTTLLIAENKTAKKLQSLSAKEKTKRTAKKEQQAEIASVSAAAPVLNYSTMSVATDTMEYVFKTNKASSEDKPITARPSPAADLSNQLQGKVSGLSVLPSTVTFSGRVVDENNKPIAGVTVASNDKKAVALTDISGYFNLQKNDTLLNVTASTVGYDNRTMALKQGINNAIVLKQNNADLNEVIVVGYGTKKKRDAYADSITLNQNPADSAMPIGGWNNFNNYVITQLNKDTTTSAITNPNDLVELEFLIDKAGNPYNIKVTNSSNEAQSSKAMEILKNGPKWTKTNHSKKAKVVINF